MTGASRARPGDRPCIPDEESLFKSDAVNEENSKRDRATQEEEDLFKANAVN